MRTIQIFLSDIKELLELREFVSVRSAFETLKDLTRPACRVLLLGKVSQMADTCQRPQMTLGSHRTVGR